MAAAPRRIVSLVLAALLLTSLGSLAAPTAVRAAWASDSFSTADEDLMVQLVNQARLGLGLTPVAVDATVHDVARSRSKDMIDRDFFSHSIPPEGYTVDHYMRQQGISFSWWGETIGKNTYSDSTATQAMFDWFMGSSPHRAILLESRATHIGVGAYKGTWQSSANTHMYTMVFIQAPGGGGDGTPTPQPTVAPTPQPTAAPTPQPTVAPTPQPTAAPTAKPAAAPTAEPAAAPTAEPTATPTPETTATATPETTATATPESSPSASSTPADPASALSASVPSSAPVAEADPLARPAQSSLGDDVNLGILLLGTPMLLCGLLFGLALVIHRRLP